MALKPFNVSIIEPDEYIERKGCLPVTVHSIYEPATTSFHPDGLFSEVIFGQLGTPQRLTTKGYMDLHTTVISPHLYKQLLALKGYYVDILAGREYAVFDRELKDLVKVGRDDPNGRTGYNFFVETLPSIVFPETNSTKRHDKIELLKKYKDRLFMTKFLILPAGLRDVKEKNGRTSSEDINKLYQGLLSLTQAMPATGSDDPVYDSIRYQIQNKIQQIYAYICNILDGKGGFLQSKYAARGIAWSNRNVITAGPVSRVSSPDAPNIFSANEVLTPLFQTMKSAVPLVIHKLKSIFMDPIFPPQTTSIPVIDSDFKLQYKEIPPVELRKFTTSEGLEGMINDFRDPHTHNDAVTIQTLNSKTPDYLMLVYDLGNEVYYFRNLDDFKHQFSHVDHFTTENMENLSIIDELNPSKYAILGSSALKAFGYVHYNQDVDLVVDDETFKRIKSDSNFTRKENGCYSRNDGHLDIYNDIVLKDQKIDDYIKSSCITVNGRVFTSPATLLSVYEESNRAKDQRKIDFLRHIVFDISKVRPLTQMEMFYCATYQAVKGKGCTATRHPVLNIEGIAMFKVHVMSTSPSRIVTMKAWNNESEYVRDLVLPEYPIIGDIAKSSMSMHPSVLAKYNGDHDGEYILWSR